MERNKKQTFGVPPPQDFYDDRFYTKGQVDSKLSGKSDTGHTHVQFIQETKFSNGTYTDPLKDVSVAIKASGGIAADLIYEGGSTLSSKYQAKGSYASSTHTHDDRYYTETEMNSKLAGKAEKSHTHDDRYYTESEIDTKLSGYLPTNGNAVSSSFPKGFNNMTEAAAWGSGNKIGDFLTGWHTSNGGDISFRDNKGQLNVVIDGFFYQNEGNNLVLDSSNYNNYAPSKTGTGASGTWSISVTGSAGSLSSSAGSSVQPVYFSNGKPVATTYSLNKTVPADAKFTDTNTWRGVQNNLTSDLTDQSLSAAQGKILKNLVDEKIPHSTIDTAIDLNTLTETGIYHIKTTSYTNAPATNHSTVFVDFTVGTPYQIFIPDASNTMYKRNYNKSAKTWAGWAQMKFTDTVYTHPSYTAKSSGLYKVTVDATGHVSATTAVTKADITGLGIPGSDTNTWRGIQNNLTSDSTSDSLSAAQGKVLKSLVDGKLSLSGGTMTGPISYKGTKNTNQMIKFKDNTSDIYGNGIVIGGGGATIIGGGESADTIAATVSSGGDEVLYLCNDGVIDFYTNCQDGASSAKHTCIDGNGNFSGNSSTSSVSAKLGRNGDVSTPMIFNWSGKDGQPSWLWGGSDGTNMYVYNPSNFSVNHATTASSLNEINTTLSTGAEKSAITIKTNDNGIFTVTNLSSLRNAIDFRWYGTNWQIGNIRGSSTDSVGFGFAFSSNDGETFALKSYIDTNGYYHGGVSGNASSASSVPWSGVTGKPSTYPPSSHTHSYLPLSGGSLSGSFHSKPTVSGSYNENIRIHPSPSNWTSIVMCGDDNTGDSGTSEKTWGIFTHNGVFGISKNGNGDSTLGAASLRCDTSNIWYINGNKLLDSSNYSAYAAPKSHTHSKSEVGLSNVDNTSDSSKSVKYATSSANADTVDSLHASDFFRYKHLDSALDANGTLIDDCMYVVKSSISNGAHTNHSAVLNISNIGTPFQIQIADSSVMYLYKRYKSSGKWTDWNKMSAGYADSAGSVAWGNVSGRPSSLPASDVYSWAKASSKPSYSYTEITDRPTLIKAVSANGYWGMADHDGSDSNWIRTTTAGLIPYQSGGAGGGHCGLGTSSWYFSSAYIDTVNCVNASVSGNIDVGGYIKNNNIINTTYEYQSNRGSVDWRFGSAIATGDENFFGFYDAKTGKIPLALDGNFGNIYVGFNVGSYESPTAVGVYLGAQVAGNRAFIYNGDSYQGSIWIQTRLDGSWKWFSLGRACSTALSDIRLKGDIRDTEVQDATKVIEAMQIRSFERKDSHKKYKIGFIADELEQLDPNLVDGGGEIDGHPNYKSVNNLQMLAYVVKAIQELNSKVNILEQENKQLKQKLNMCN